MENISQSNGNVNQLLKTFRGSLLQAAKRHVPTRKSKPRQSNPWISSTLARKVKERDKFYQKSKKEGKEKIEDRFKQLKRECQRELRQEHNNYVENLLTDEKAGNTSKKILELRQEQKIWSYGHRHSPRKLTTDDVTTGES